jgi:proline iminopeptidase
VRPRSPDPVAREGFVGEGADRLYVRDIGHGRPIMVLHGGPDFDHEYLLPETDRLAEWFRLVYYDQRGRGRSFCGQPVDDVTMASEVDDLDRVGERFELGSFAVLGHSWGALLAMEYTIRHPERVSHLVVMNSAPASRVDALMFRDELARRRSPAQAARMNELRSDPRFQAGDITLETEYYRIHYSATLRDPDQLETVVGRLRTAFTPASIIVARAIEDRLYEDTWSRPGYDLIPALRRLDIPTLIIHGDEDFVPIDAVRRVADAIPGARLVVLSGCGHFAYFEQPEQAATTITAFLNG